MTLGFCVWQKLCVDSLTNLSKEQDELAGQGLTKKSNTGSNNVLTPLKAYRSLFIFFHTKDLFLNFYKSMYGVNTGLKINKIL